MRTCWGLWHGECRCGGNDMSVSPNVSYTQTKFVSEPHGSGVLRAQCGVEFPTYTTVLLYIVRPMLLSILHLLGAGTPFLPDMVPNVHWDQLRWYASTLL